MDSSLQRVRFPRVWGQRSDRQPDHPGHTYADGSASISTRSNTHARLTDVRGAEYRFGANQYFSDTAQLDGSFQAVARYTFWLISNGRATKDFVTLDSTFR